MNLQPNILFTFTRVLLSVGDDVNDHNLLLKGAPFHNGFTSAIVNWIGLAFSPTLSASKVGL
jgi:hypothetical protein